MKKFIAAAATITFGLFILPAQAKDPAGTKVQAKLICGEHSANPEKMRAYQRDITFLQNGPQLNGGYKGNDEANISFTGIVSPTGDILITGFGENKKGGKWIYQFNGKSNPNGDTELQGRLENTSGAVGGRDCTFIFMKPRAL